MKMFALLLLLVAVAALLLDAFTTFRWGGAIAGCVGIALSLMAILMPRTESNTS